jgi:hypothetical protein
MGRQSEFFVFYNEQGLCYYTAVSLFVLGHWQFSYFYLKTSIQLRRKQTNKHLCSDRTFVVINAVTTILILIALVYCCMGK